MEYQKIINLLDNTTYQLSKFKTRNWIEINRDIRFKTTMLNFSFCDYGDAYIFVKGTILMMMLKQDKQMKKRKV